MKILKLLIPLFIPILFSCSKKSSIKNSKTLSTGWYYIAENPNTFKRQLDKSTEIYFLDSLPILTVNNFKNLNIYEASNDGKTYYGLKISLDDEGKEKWSIATEKATGKQLGFILNDKLLYTPEIMSQITGGITALNRGNYSKEELERFKAEIEKSK